MDTAPPVGLYDAWKEANPQGVTLPRQRVLLHGPKSLSNEELLSLVIGSGTEEKDATEIASVVLKKYGGLGGLMRADAKSLKKIKGVGAVKSIEILACVEMGRRFAMRAAESLPVISAPEDVADLLMSDLRDQKQEHFISLPLDTKNRVLKTVTVSIGTLDSTIVHPREVFREAIALSAASIVVAHNHPSGDPTPSPQDRDITQRLIEAGKILGIDLLDHIVIGADRWVSLKQVRMI